MLSVPHMIVIFVVVLVVFGPKKLPELARGLGKLMAEFRKASTDFRSAFEQEMRDLERQAMQAERKKQAETAAKAAAETSAAESATDTVPGGEPTASTETASESSVPQAHEIAPVIAPVAEAVPRATEETLVDEAPAVEEPLASANRAGLAGPAPSAEINDIEHDQRPA